jgi:hypothetical protein
VGAYDDGRSADEIDRTISWDQAGDVKFLREKYKVLTGPSKIKCSPPLLSSTLEFQLMSIKRSGTRSSRP